MSTPLCTVGSVSTPSALAHAKASVEPQCPICASEKMAIEDKLLVYTNARTHLPRKYRNDRHESSTAAAHRPTHLPRPVDGNGPAAPSHAGKHVRQGQARCVVWLLPRSQMADDPASKHGAHYGLAVTGHRAAASLGL